MFAAFHFLFTLVALTESRAPSITYYPCCEPNNTYNCHLSDFTEKLHGLGDNSAVLIENKYNYLHNYNFTIENKRNVTLTGTGLERPIICCRTSSLTFQSITKLYIKNLVFVGCGFIVHETRKVPPAAVMIYQCHDIHFENIIIAQSRGLGLAVLNTSGKNSIKGCIFTSNGNNTSKKSAYGGGMLLYIENSTKEADYCITGCLFQNNVKKLNIKRSKNYDTGHGGGLNVSLRNIKVVDTKKYLRVYIEESAFMNNKAENGGGAKIELYNCTQSFISMTNCIFSGNNAERTKISNGGGLQIKHYGLENNTIEVNRCNFTHNKAYFGGGLSIDCGFKYNNKLLFIRDCCWICNNATSGAAVDITRIFPVGIKQNQTIEPIFENCTFEHNIVSYSKITKSFAVGYGVFTVIGTNVHFKSNILFLSNNESALSATLSTIIISPNCSLIFRNNVGTSGGALSLNAARLLLYKNTSVKFTSNHASKYGGALYSVVTDDHMLFTQISCPFAFVNCVPTEENDCNTSIHFNDNKADSAGDSIYLTSLLPCQIAYSSRTQAMINAKEVFNLKPFRPSINDIRTAPSSIIPSDMIRSIEVYPGEQNILQLTLKDDLNNTVPSNLTILEATVNPESQKLKMKEVYMHNYKYTILGKPKTQAMVRFQTTEKPLLIIRRNVTLKDCPPAYIFNISSKRCECNESKYYGITKCSDKNDFFQVYVRKGVWCGYQDGQFVTGSCHWFCYAKIPHGDNTFKIKFQRIKENPDQQDYLCRRNREGVFCSKCKENYTVYYHSDLFYCGPNKNCSWGWLIFIASEILPVTLVFIAIIMTGFNVTSGYIQGFLLYSHILYSLPHEGAQLSHIVYQKSFLRIFYYPLNLRFFYFKSTSFCLFSKANTLDIATIEYFQNIYCIFLIFIVAFFLRCFVVYCRGCNRWIRFTTAKNSALIGISALLVLSYTSAVEVSLVILQVSPLYTKGYEIQSQRVALYGDEKYFSPAHMKYAIPACLCLVVLIVPALMLLTYPLVLGILSYFNIDADQSWIGVISTKCYMYTHLKPFYDMFYASFKDKHRYFAGLYFIYRAVIQLAYYVPFFIEESIVMEALLITFLIIHATIQPYNKKSHNLIDALLLGNLVIINGIISISMVTIYINGNESLWKPRNAAFVRVVLSNIPMCVVLAYIVWKYVLLKLQKLLKRFQARGEYQQLIESTSCHINHHRLTDSSLEYNRNNP